MTQTNRPAPRFQVEQDVWTSADWFGYVRTQVFHDGGWVYGVTKISYPDKLWSYAEHELTEAGR